jgi:multiple sugar transport system substrate-binding protein
MRRSALALALVATLAACSDGGGPRTGASPGASGPVSGTITVQAAGGEGELNALRELVAAFERAHPGTTVEFTGLAEQGQHVSKLGTSFAGGQPPDVFLLNYRRFGRFAKQGVIDPPALPEGEYYQPSLDAFTFGGSLLCLPQNVSSSVMYLNTALFAKAGVPLPKAGWTFDDLRATAAALKAKGVKTIGFETGFRTVPAFVWAKGGEVVDSTDDPTVITLDTPEGRGALEYLKGLLDDGGVDATDAAASSAEDRFARGELAMFVDSRRAVPSFRKADGLDFDVVPLPRDKAAATLLASDAYCVAKASRNLALARAFARYAVGPDGGTVLAASGRTVPSLRSVAESDAYLAPGKEPASSRVWLDVIPTVRRLPNVANWNEAETTATDALEQYFAGKASLDATVTGIAKESRRLLAQEG